MGVDSMGAIFRVLLNLVVEAKVPDHLEWAAFGTRHKAANLSRAGPWSAWSVLGVWCDSGKIVNVCRFGGTYTRFHL
jgi:hypothetical protein